MVFFLGMNWASIQGLTRRPLILSFSCSLLLKCEIFFVFPLIIFSFIVCFFLGMELFFSSWNTALGGGRVLILFSIVGCSLFGREMFHLCTFCGQVGLINIGCVLFFLLTLDSRCVFHASKVWVKQYCQIALQLASTPLNDMHIPTIDPIEYHTLVGKLSHTTQTCPSIIFDINYIFHFMQAPQVPQLLVAQCVFKYLNYENIGKSLSIVSFTYVDFTSDIEQKYIYFMVSFPWCRFSNFLIKKKMKLYCFVFN